jgi:GH15 family glucan-1,4-alpha-glucosidase
MVARRFRRSPSTRSSRTATQALIAPDGSVEWLCLPRFDGESVFGALLDRSAGAFRLAPYGVDVPAGRRYIPGTNVLETTWMTPTGWASSATR